MRDKEFFEQVAQVTNEAGGYEYRTPTFYQDMTTLNVAFLTPQRRIRKLLPSRKMKPLRMTPRHGITAITAFEYRESDIGPYNEVAISFPVTMGDRRPPMFFGTMRALQEPTAYVWQLPVTTEIARYGGVELYGFPKFIAEIEFTSDNGWITCHLAADGKDIFTLKVREMKTKRGERSLTHALTIKEKRILRSEIVTNVQKVGQSRRKDDVKLELGDHEIAKALQKLNLGRVLQVQYMPENQAILSYVMESTKA